MILLLKGSTNNVVWFLCYPVGLPWYIPRTYVLRFLCSPVPMFPGTNVPRFLYFNSSHYHKPFTNLITKYDTSRSGLCLDLEFWLGLQLD